MKHLSVKPNHQNITWNFKRILYALQVIVIAIAIPLLSYMELTHVDKPDDLPADTRSIKMEKPVESTFTMK